MFYLKLSIQISIVFIFLILGSFITDQFHSFLGDTLKDSLGFTSHGLEKKGEYWDWGWRHQLLCCMGVCLFIVQAIRIWVSIDKHFSK